MLIKICSTPFFKSFRAAFAALSFLLVSESGFSQLIPASRTVDWSLAGLRDSVTEPLLTIDVTSFGAQGDGITINDLPLQNAIAAAGGDPAVIFFPGGTYLFNASVSLPSSIIIRGDSSSLSTLQFDLSGAAQDLFRVTGSSSASEYALMTGAQKDGVYLLVPDSAGIAAGTWIKLFQDDDTLVTSSWALNSVAQIIQVTRVSGDSVFLASPLRRDFPLSETPRIKKLFPKTSVGFECFKIERLDSTAAQTSNFNFDMAVNCRIRGVESSMTNFAHVAVSSSSNLLITGSYFHHAFAYGGGGQGYGVLLQFSTGEVLVENNIFKNLRHSMILQAGANGNVFGYNYSRDPYWNEGSFPVNSAGDMVLHGNYVFANLFEGNVGQNIVIDNSHGINGPYNTFFRNRAALYGLIMNTGPASNDQNFVGNEITNTGSFMGNYYLAGTGHFQYGNMVKGVLTPAGTSGLSNASYYLTAPPAFFAGAAWPSIGPPYPYNTGTIPAVSNYNSGTYVVCEDALTEIASLAEKQEGMYVYPNPAGGPFSLKINGMSGASLSVRIFDAPGRMVYERDLKNASDVLFDVPLAPGVYVIVVSDGKTLRRCRLVSE
ncbi:MAG: hypothetical protein JWO09_3543 [Bacteroidetes bacterium]|nr:hypothetical protein [Bacteroidota bacterium]